MVYILNVIVWAVFSYVSFFLFLLVYLSNDQVIVQSERNSHSKKRCGKKLSRYSSLIHREHIVYLVCSYFW